MSKYGRFVNIVNLVLTSLGLVIHLAITFFGDLPKYMEWITRGDINAIIGMWAGSLLGLVFVVLAASGKRWAIWAIAIMLTIDLFAGLITLEMPLVSFIKYSVWAVLNWVWATEPEEARHRPNRQVA